MVRKITVTRPTTYPSRWQVIRKNKVVEVKTFPYGTHVNPPRPNKYEKWFCIDRGGQGREIVHEASLCTDCAQTIKGEDDVS